MPTSTCKTCGAPYLWLWEEAFDKFGFADGDGQVMTHQVALGLQRAGYSVTYEPWGFHNTVITSITRNGVEQIPATANLGYDDPREYLPDHIVKRLDDELAPEHEVAA